MEIQEVMLEDGSGRGQFVDFLVLITVARILRRMKVLISEQTSQDYASSTVFVEVIDWAQVKTSHARRLCVLFILS